MAGLDYAVARPGELNRDEMAAWDGLQWEISDALSPFMSARFASIFDAHRRDTRVAVVQDAGEIVGFFPYEKRSLRVGRGLGYGLSDAQGMVRRADAEIDRADLLDACGIDVWQFDHLIGSQAQRLEGNVTMQASPVIEVHGVDFDEWFARKRKESRRVETGAQKKRKLAREVGPLHFEPDCRDAEMLRTLMMWKSDQYRRTGRFDRFADGWFRRIVEECFYADDPSFSGRLSVLYAGNAPVTMDFSLLGNGVLTGWFPAYDPRFAKYSPGFVGILSLIEAAFADPGITLLDMGKGHAAYKESLKTKDHAVGEGWVQRRTPAAVAWRMRTLPRRMAMRAVLSNDKTRLGARKTLAWLGTARSRFQ